MCFEGCLYLFRKKSLESFVSEVLRVCKTLEIHCRVYQKSTLRSFRNGSVFLGFWGCFCSSVGSLRAHFSIKCAFGGASFEDLEKCCFVCADFSKKGPKSDPNLTAFSCGKWSIFDDFRPLGLFDTIGQQKSPKRHPTSRKIVYRLRKCTPKLDKIHIKMHILFFDVLYMSYIF